MINRLKYFRILGRKSCDTLPLSEQTYIFFYFFIENHNTVPTVPLCLWESGSDFKKVKIRNMTYIQPDQDPKYFNKIIRYSRISWAFLRKLSVQTIGRIWRNNFDPDVWGSQHWFPEMNKLFDPQGSQTSVMRPPRSQLLHRWGGKWWRGITVFYNNTGIHLHLHLHINR